MNREELLGKIIEAIDPVDDVVINEDTIIADCDDIDSLALFNIVILYKSLGFDVKIQDFIKCKTIKDMLNLAL